MCKYDSNGDRARNYLLNISLPSNHCSVKEAEVTPPWWKETLKQILTAIISKTAITTIQQQSTFHIFSSFKQYWQLVRYYLKKAKIFGRTDVPSNDREIQSQNIKKNSSFLLPQRYCDNEKPFQVTFGANTLCFRFVWSFALVYLKG